MATFSYKICINDIDGQEILKEAGIQIKSIRKMLFSLFPDHKQYIRDVIPERILRIKVCWGSEKEWTDLENRLRVFFKKIQTSVENGHDLHQLTYEADLLIWFCLEVQSPVREGAYINYYYTHKYLSWLETHKYYFKERFKLEMLRKLKDQIKSPEGNDVIFQYR